MDERPSEAKKTDFDVKSVYANNVYYESSVWDLKLIFGQLEQHTGEAKVDWHTSITIPWVQAKLISYFLQINIAIHESGNGKVIIPPSVLPTPPPAPEEELEKNPEARRMYELLTKIHQAFVADNSSKGK